MKRIWHIAVTLFIGTLPFTLGAVLSFSPSSKSDAQAIDDARDSPPDRTHYVRPAVPADYGTPGRPALPNVVTPQAVVRDVIVSNTDATLTNTDTFGDGEPSIAINPSNPDEIAITAFSGSWGTNTPIFHSTDGGETWTKRFTIPAPPGVPSAINCPCDQTIDFDRNNNIAGTFLTFMPTDVYSGISTDLTNAGAWNWRVNMGVAQPTNSAGAGNVDQPWLLYNRDTALANQDNIYVAYDDFSIFPLGMRVAVSLGTNPPNFVRDNQLGTSTNCVMMNCINPGHRLAVNSANGWVYSLFQQNLGNGDDDSKSIGYMLNRSTDGGQTWGLNGNATGIQVATADSTQPTPKFGTVNALLGGVDHATVDPATGDVYYVYGNRDAATNNNRLAVRRLTTDGMGMLTVGAEVFITGQVQAALPSAAVAANGTLGVLYTQYDGMSGGGIPMFSVHFALSMDQGATFPTDIVLENFLSSATDNGNARQRVLGDYQQVKALGNTFYGTFTGNGVPFGRPFANHDPIFFRVPLACEITCPASIVTTTAPNQCGAVVTYDAPTAISCGTVSCSPPSGSFFPTGMTTVTCTAEAGTDCSFTVTVNDTQPPTIMCPADQTAVTPQNVCTTAPAIVNYPLPTVADNCPGVVVACVPPPGSPFMPGVTSVTCTATDTAGNATMCSFTLTVFDARVQDDSNPARVILWNTATGSYRVCCNGTVYTGTGVVAVKGCTFTLTDVSLPNRRVNASIDKSIFKGSGALQSPPGTTVCTITDRDVRNSTSICQ